MSVITSYLTKVQKKGLTWAIKRFFDKFGFSFFSSLFALGAWLPFKKKRLAVLYACDFCPATFDAVWFFMAAEMQRRKHKCEEIVVVFYPQIEAKIESYGMAFDNAGNKWRFEQIVLPLASLFPNISSYTIETSKFRAYLRLLGNRVFFPKKIGFEEMMQTTMKELAKAKRPWGIEVSQAPLRYVQSWKQSKVGGKKLIVITLRKSNVAPKRNSKIKEWAKFAGSLNPTLYHVVFVADTDTILETKEEELKDFEFFEAASWNVGMRAALYQEAYLNLTTHIGPLTLCILNNQCRVLAFKIMIKEEPSACEELINRLGLESNKNPPWTHAFQKYVWEDDDFEVIKKEFEGMCKKIDG